MVERSSTVQGTAECCIVGLRLHSLSAYSMHSHITHALTLNNVVF